METFHDLMMEYKKQMLLGVIPKAYQGLMGYMSKLKNYLKAEHPDYSVSGSMYFGYMDMTYFSFFPDSLKKRGLKTGIVFIHETVKFEAWLAGYNRQVQLRYWKLFKESGWNKHRIPSTIKGADSIIECTLADNPDFSHPDALTLQIESGTLSFIRDIEDFLSGH